MHGGTIQAFSAGAGQGSEFVVRLPALTGSTASPPPDRPVEVPPAKQSTRRILVVDDNMDGARSLSILLRALGHDVQTAHDGVVALETAQHWPPEVVLLDIGLPRLNGLEVARRMREDLGLSSALLIAMTGYGQNDDRKRSQEAGFNAHLVKPLDLDVLKTLLAEFTAATSESP
jgi:CheY-like chemotaxis protein